MGSEMCIRDSTEIDGIKIELLLVEEKIDILKELYASVFLDRDLASPVIMVSEHGGVDVEEQAEIFKVEVNPLIGIQPFMVRNVLRKLKLDKSLRNQLEIILYKLYNIFNEIDAELVEINPLAITPQGNVIALDAKIIVDDNAIFRHSNFQKSIRRGLTEFERMTSELGVRGVEIGGEIGVITSGAGCLMATIDTIKSYGGSLAATIDLGGSVFNLDRLSETISGCISSMIKLKPKVILINAYFQLAKCSIFAKAILDSLKDEDCTIPVVVRLKGREDEIAEKILSSLPNVFFTKNFDEACKTVCEICGREDK